jgi:glucan phosphoethanolaminetransferase (alkaline phosphatase superfamily)
MKPSAFHPAQIPLGLSLWAVWFVALYGGVAVACELLQPAAGEGMGAINLGFVLFTLLTALLPIYYAVQCWRATRHAAGRTSQERFAARVGAAMHVIAVVAIVFVGVPLLGLPPCL